MPELRLYGPPSVLLASGEALSLSAREAALMAWLVKEGPTTRARVAGLLWPSRTEAQARANLRQTLVRLRKTAGEVVADDAGVLSVPLHVRVHAPQAHDARPLLDGLEFDDAPEYAQWLDASREAARRERQRYLLASARAALDASELDHALQAADAVLADAPESEQAWRVRMEVFEARGDRASGLAAWDECRLALRKAFGVSPSAETEAVGRRLLAETVAGLVRPELPRELKRPPAAIGRAHTLAEAVQTARLGHVVLALGPGGIGKSRLIADLVQSLGGGLVVNARPGDRLRPASLVSRLLGSALQAFRPQLEPAVAADVKRFLPSAAGAERPADLTSSLEHERVLRSVGAALVACYACGLRTLALDDLHHADDTSIDAIQRLLEEWLAGAGEGLAIVIGARPDELGDNGKRLVDMLLQAGRAARIDLAPLDIAQVQELLGTLQLPEGVDRARLASALHARLGGVPSFVLESLKLLWLDGWSQWREAASVPVPPTVRESVRKRLERLSPDALALAQLAAVAQDDLSGALASAVLGRSTLALAQSLAELQAGQWMDGERFAHDLIAEEVLASVPAALVRTLHAQIAGELISLGASAASVAQHLHSAADTKAAAPWHRKAAEEMRRAWQMRDAASAFERAARGFEAAGNGAEVVSASREAARCWLVLSATTRAHRALDAADAAATTSRERMLVGSTRTSLLFNAGRSAEAATRGIELARELARASDQLSTDEAGQALLSVAIAAPYMREPQDLLTTCGKLRERAAAGSAFANRIDFCEAMTLGWMGRPMEAQALLDRAWENAAAARQHGELVNIGNQLIRCAEMQGALDRAIEACDLTRDAIGKAGAGIGFETDLASHRALLLAAAGRKAEALLASEEWLALRGGKVPEGGYEPLRHAITLFLCGQAEAAAGHLRQLLNKIGDAESPLAAHAAWAALRLLSPHETETTRLLAHAARCCLHRGGVLWLRQQVMLTRAGRLAPDDVRELVATLRARGMQGLARSVDRSTGEGWLDPWCG